MIRLPPALLDALARMPRLFRAAQPATAVEITDEHVAMARVARSGDAVEVPSYFAAALPVGAVRSAPALANVARPEDLAPVLAAARAHVAPSAGAVALLLPDCLARVSLIAADTLPRRRDELRDLVGWRLKKTLPFRMDEAQLDTQAYPLKDGRVVILAAAIRKKVLAEYEQLLEAQGFHVGSVTLSTLALAEALPADASGDVMLLNVGSGWFSMLITNGVEPTFYRCKPLPEAERRGAERDWFVTGEMFPTMEYYTTRLSGAGLSRIVLHVAGPGAETLRETLQTVVTQPIEMLQPASDPSLPAEAASRLHGVVALAMRGLRREQPASGGAAA